MSVELEKFCVVQPYASAWLPPHDDKWHQIRPGYSRKIYPNPKKSRRIYMAAVLEPRDEIRPVEEIAKLVDKRSLAQLQEQAADALKQMLYRAHCGDKEAIAEYLRTTHAAVASLETLAQHQPSELRGQAEVFSRYPVLLSLNPQDINAAKQQLNSLGVGTISPLPSRIGQRVDRRNFWTRLATQAVTACADNKRRVPALKALGAGAKRERKTQRYWGTTIKATLYYLASGDAVIITDWQNKCLKLSGPITQANFRDWWAVVKSCVFEHWKNPKGNYAEALRRIGRANEEEWRRRNLAIDRVEQALRSVLGLR